MEINVHLPAIYPCGNLVRNGRKGMEEGLLIQISLIAVALAFLETAVVECMEFLEHRSFQILKVTKNLVPEPGDDRCRYLSDGSL